MIRLLIDEKRVDFEPTLWTPRSGVDLQQVWFAGSHGDIGGTYPPDSNGKRVADVTLQWMLDEAESAGLVIERHLRDALQVTGLGKLHESRRRIYRLRKPLHRPLVVPGKPTSFHASVKQRFESDSRYRPPGLATIARDQGWRGA